MTNKKAAPPVQGQEPRTRRDASGNIVTDGAGKVKTNRAALMGILEELTDREFEYVLFSGKSDIDCMLEGMVCIDCRETHSGKCPHPDDDGCALTLEDWLRMACRNESTIRRKVWIAAGRIRT